MPVLQEVLYVGHLMMHTDQTALIDVRANLHTEIVTITKVPGRGFAEYASIQRLFEDGIPIKLRTHGRHINRCEEFLGQLKHQQRRITLLDHARRDINELSTRIGYQDVQHIRPGLSVHITQYVRGYWRNAIDAIGSVVIPQLATHIRMQTLVERTNLFPNNVHILTEVARLVGQVPVLAAIGDIYKRVKVSQVSIKLSDPLTVHIGHLLHDIDELLVVIAHTSPYLAMILHPGVLQLIPVSALGHNVLEMGYIVQITLKGLLISTDARIVIEKQHLVQQPIVLQGKH